jgi:hypothetical protein
LREVARGGFPGKTGFVSAPPSFGGAMSGTAEVPPIAENQNGAVKGGLLGPLPFGRHLLSHREKEFRFPHIHSTQKPAEPIENTCVLA